MKYVSVDDELEIPEDITLDISPDKLVTVKGKKGTLTKDFSHVKFVQIFKEGNKICFHADFPRKKIFYSCSLDAYLHINSKIESGLLEHCPNIIKSLAINSSH